MIRLTPNWVARSASRGSGNPGRNEIDETQELNYPAIMRAIVATGYKGFVGQEFIPKRDPLTSLQQAIQLCDV